MNESNASGVLNSPRPSSAPLLSIEDVSVRFAGVKALSDVSFHVQPGELFAVIGPNGAGKTSLFNVISRVYQPVTGSVTYDGRDLLRLKTYQVARIGIARTFQNLGQFPIHDRHGLPAAGATYTHAQRYPARRTVFHSNAG